uniref:Phosphatidylinositol 4-phosphate 3-kinase C2 domain-containing subunit alpha n=1 Tax=Cacopsylla melanoneura TaxID=428564 RepID=A0A8D8S4J0_9HEMI
MADDEFDKKFQEDLEKAQALSLEALAFEEFRKRKLQSELSQYSLESCTSSSNHSSTKKESSVKNSATRYESPPGQTEVKLDQIQPVSRPRPGALIKGLSESKIAVLKPPPSVGKRPSTSSQPDLISFGSPIQESAPGSSLDATDSFEEFTAPSLPVQPNNSNYVNNSPVCRNLGFDLTSLTSNLPSPNSQLSILPSPSSSSHVFPYTPFSSFSSPPQGTQYSIPPQYGWIAPSTPNYSHNSLSHTQNSLSHSQNTLSHSQNSSSYCLNSLSYSANSCMSNALQLSNLQQSLHQSTPGSHQHATVSSSTEPLAIGYGSSSGSGVGATTSGELSVLKVVEKKDNNNLIDWDPGPLASMMTSGYDPNRVRVSILEAFDPLCSSPCGEPVDPNGNLTTSNLTPIAEDQVSHSTSSIYDPYDPCDYLYEPTDSGSGDPVYAVVTKKPPPPLPAKKLERNVSVEERTKSIKRSVSNAAASSQYENIQIIKRRAALSDPDLLAFHAMVKSLRSEFVANDSKTNSGLVVSPTLENTYTQDTSVKLIIYNSVRNLNFTSNVSTSIEHVMLHIVCELDAGSASDYVLKVYSKNEYFAERSTILAEYEYVHECIKLERDIELTLLHIDQLERSLARTSQDDLNDASLSLDDLLPKEMVQPISHESLLILLETFEKEVARYEQHLNTGKNVAQSVKAVCTLLGNVETLEISSALEEFIATDHTDSNHSNNNSVEIGHEIDDNYSYVRLNNTLGHGGGGGGYTSELFEIRKEKLFEAVHNLVTMYCQAFRVNFTILPTSTDEMSNAPKLSSEILEAVLVQVSCLHRLAVDWTHDEYLIAAQIYYGTRPLAHPIFTKSVRPSQSMYTRLVFDSWLQFDQTSVCLLPREARLVLVLYGRTVLPQEGSNDSPEPEVTQVELGWTSLQFFNFERRMASGQYLLSLWPPSCDKRLGPAPAPASHPQGDTHPVLAVELPPSSGCDIRFPSPPSAPLSPPIDPDMYDFSSLDDNTQQTLINLCQETIFERPRLEDREILWEKRHYLVGMPSGLAKVLLAAHSWDYACLNDLHSMLHSWAPLEPVPALQLLLPCFPDCEVRRVAISWIQKIASDELVDYLAQLVQALKSETYETNALAQFLLERALLSPRVAHHLYWLLIQTLPGHSPQNSAVDDVSIGEARSHRRLQLLLRALLATCGEALRNRFMCQQLLVKNLHSIAENIKTCKESHRMRTLSSELESLHTALQQTPTCLPLSPSLEVKGIDIRTCSYFPSNTLPLKISFLSSELRTIPAIFKVGDDLQQDMLTLQMIRIMDKMWLREGLDLKMVTFSCVPTGHKRGIIEMVQDAETLRKIQVELGLTGSFKDRPIAEWLAKHNPSALEYERAVANFTASCAGYSVATYVLGICDRHNDNIMLKTSGHLFHIDFGKFLGDAQMFGNFKRDRTPFVLTPDMVYVINGGDKSSDKFQNFIDLCCQAFNIVRKHGNLLLNLFGLMASSGIPGVTMSAVHYVQSCLLPHLSNAESAASFARLIHSSVRSRFVQLNFFIHNLSQLRFTADSSQGPLLSFIPRTYTLAQDGRIVSVEVYGYQKRYDPDKYYVFILKVERERQRDPTYLFRSFREFEEFQQKLCTYFPLSKFASLQCSGLTVGRSNIKHVAEKRRHDIKRFLDSLFNMADEICHSDLVYTFFHPLLRDQQEANIHETKLKERKTIKQMEAERRSIRGEIKLSIHYERMRNSLMVMVQHVKELPMVGGQEPSSYVKVYLLPDTTKSTKRKTKVVKKSCNPSFMEMLVYRLPYEIIQHRTLQATVWNHDTLQENEFLGGISFPLNDLEMDTEVTAWHPLDNVTTRHI